MQTALTPTLDEKLVKLAEINQFAKESGLSLLQKEKLIDISIGALPTQIESTKPWQKSYRNAAHYLGISYQDAIDLNDRHSDFFWSAEESDLLDFEKTVPELDGLILYSCLQDAYLNSGDQGFHHHIEVNAGQKKPVAALLKDFKSEFPLIIIEMPDNKPSFSSSPEESCNACTTDCTSPDYDLEADINNYHEQLDQNQKLLKSVRDKAKNVFLSDDSACLKLKGFVDTAHGLTDVAWAILYQESYLSKVTENYKEIENCPHYHLVARPGKKQETLDLIKEFDSDYPVIVTEMKMSDYLRKITPSKFSY